MFSEYIFRAKKDIDLQRDKEYIILKVLEYWTIEDWKKLEKLYWKDEIINVAKKRFYNLSNRTLALAEVIFDVFLPRNTQENVLKPWFSNRFQKRFAS